MIRITLFTILLLLMSFETYFGQSAFNGLVPGKSTKQDAERVLGQPLRDISETLSEYKSTDAEAQLFVQYRRGTSIVERIELVYARTKERAGVLRSRGLTTPAASQTNSRGKFEEYYATAFIVLTYDGADSTTGVSRVGHYSRELYESASAKVSKSGGTAKTVPDSRQPDFLIENEKVLSGTSLGYYPKDRVEQCQSDCANNPNCKGFTWIKADKYNLDDSAMCYLMKTVTGSSPARGHTSGKKVKQ